MWRVRVCPMRRNRWVVPDHPSHQPRPGSPSCTPPGCGGFCVRDPGWRTPSRASPRATGYQAFGLKSSTPNQQFATQEVRGVGLTSPRKAMPRLSRLETRGDPDDGCGIGHIGDDHRTGTNGCFRADRSARQDASAKTHQRVRPHTHIAREDGTRRDVRVGPDRALVFNHRGRVDDRVRPNTGERIDHRVRTDERTPSDDRRGRHPCSGVNDGGGGVPRC